VNPVGSSRATSSSGRASDAHSVWGSWEINAHTTEWDGKGVVAGCRTEAFIFELAMKSRASRGFSGVSPRSRRRPLGLARTRRRIGWTPSRHPVYVAHPIRSIDALAAHSLHWFNGSRSTGGAAKRQLGTRSSSLMRSPAVTDEEKLPRCVAKFGEYFSNPLPVNPARRETHR
jgi:hypothetical protein